MKILKCIEKVVIIAQYMMILSLSSLISLAAAVGDGGQHPLHSFIPQFLVIVIINIIDGDDPTIF